MIEWFRHDTSARNDIKIRKLLRDSDPGALSAYWMCVEIIYQSGGYAEKQAIAEELSFYDMDGYIPLLISHELIEDVGDGIVTSQRVLSEIKWQEDRRLKKVEAGRKGGLSTQAKASTAKQGQAMLKQCLSDAKAHSSTIQDNTRQDNITTLTNVRVVGDQQADAPTPKEANTDLFGEKIKVETDIEKVPFDEIANYWNSKLKGKLPSIREITAKRKSLIRQRWHEYKGDVYTAIDNVAASDFLTGWKSCGFDWCFGKDNFIKIIEGNYRNGSHSRPLNRYNGKAFRPTDLNGQYDDLPPGEVIEA